MDADADKGGLKGNCERPGTRAVKGVEGSWEATFVKVGTRKALDCDEKPRGLGLAGVENAAADEKAGTDIKAAGANGGDGTD